MPADRKSPPQLVAASATTQEVEVWDIGGAKITVDLRHHKYTQELAMNRDAATTLQKVAEYQYAVPAQERTKRDLENTKRLRLRAFIYSPTLLLGIFAMTRVSEGTAKWIAIAIVAVLGSVEAFQALDRWLSRKEERKLDDGKQ